MIVANVRNAGMEKNSLFQERIEKWQTHFICFRPAAG